MAFTALQFLFLVAVATSSLSSPVWGSPVTHACGKPADVVFVIDTSSSIWPKEFREFALPFLKDVVSAFSIGPGSEQTRVGAVTYSNNAHLEFKLNTYLDHAGVLDGISNIKFHGGSTFTDKALRYVNRHMFLPENGGREGVAHIVVVLTDGKSSKHPATVEQARLARESGISIFAIGVGAAEEEELQLIASEPATQFKFKVTGYAALDGIKIELALKACEITLPPTTTETPTTTTTTTTTTTPTTTTTTPTTTTTTTTTTTEAPKSHCGGRPADIFFILDTSSSIWKRDFDTSVLRFVRDTVSNFDIGYDMTRVGVMTFSDSPRLVIPLDAHRTKEALLRAINPRVVRYTLGGTNTGEALRDTRVLGFGPAKWRTDVAKIAVVITDGQSWDEERTRQEAALLKEEGVKIYAIGVGKGTKQAELEAIANDPKEDFVFSVDGFKALTELKEVLAIKACRETELASDQPTCGSGPTDVTFAVDSNTLTLSQKRQVLSQIQTVTERLKSVSGDVRLSLQSGPCTADMDFQPTKPWLANLMMKRIKKTLQPALHRVVQDWRREELSGLTKVTKRNGAMKLTKGATYKGNSKGLVLLLNSENEAESQEISKEVLLMLDAGIDVLVVLDHSVSQYTQDKWVQLLGRRRVVSGVGPDMDYSGYIMEYMCSL